jgi:hypothetical protein
MLPLHIKFVLFAAVVISLSGLATRAFADDDERLKLREDEITARIGKHFYSWREGGAGFTVVGIADKDSVYVKYDGKYASVKIYKMYARLPSENGKEKTHLVGKLTTEKFLFPF